MNKFTTILLALGAATTLHAEVKPVFSLGYDFGGDDIFTAELSSGSSTNTETISTADGLYIEGGLALSDPDGLENFSTELTFGYKFDSIVAENADITMGRFYVNVIGNLTQDKVTFGAGLTYHITPKLSGDGDANFVDAEFESAAGIILQAGYNINETSTIGLRGTFIDYETNFGEEFDASSVGLYWSVKF